MKQKLQKVSIALSVAMAVFAAGAIVLLGRWLMPGATWRELGLLGGACGVLFLVMFLVVGRMLTTRAYEQSLRPLRMMVEYLNNLLSGKFTEEAPSLEGEEQLSEMLATHREKAEFLHKLASVRENERMRRQFSANVSHELKSPLTSINGYAEMIESGMVGPEDTLRFAGIIHREGIRLLNMINEVIQLSKFDTGYSDFDQREWFDLHAVVRREVETLTSMASSHRVTLEISARGEGARNAVTLYGNRRLLTDVVRNLLSNAIKYSKPRGGYVRVTLSRAFASAGEGPAGAGPRDTAGAGAASGVHGAAAGVRSAAAGPRQDSAAAAGVYVVQSAALSGALVIFSVEDNGIGIAPEEQARIFERFYVVDPGRTRAEDSGTGLGLALVKHTVALHGGTLELESELGRGSRFTVTIPVQSGAVGTERMASEERTAAAESDGAAGSDGVAADAGGDMAAAGSDRAAADAGGDMAAAGSDRAAGADVSPVDASAGDVLAGDAEAVLVEGTVVQHRDKSL